MKDGRTHLAHKAEHVVDLETSAIVGVTVQDADEGDTTTSRETLIDAAEQIEAVCSDGDGASKRWSATRGTTAISRSLISKSWGRSYIAEPAGPRSLGASNGSRTVRTTRFIN